MSKNFLAYRLLGLVYWVCVSLASSGQLNIVYTPAAFGQSLEGLTTTQFINTAQNWQKVRLSIKVRETNTSSDVVTIDLPNFLIPPGASPMDRSAFSKSRFTFSANYYGSTTRQTGKFPEGEYEYCFVAELIDSKDGNILSVHEQCFVAKMEPTTPLLLLDPIEGDQFCNKRPNFVWQPPMPLGPEARFRLILVERKEKQDLTEAIAFNQPIVNQPNLRSNNLLYPFNVPELKEGHHYAWQVTVYSDKTILKRSEIWEFTIQCLDRPIPIQTESYREVKANEDGNFYVADKYLRFAVNNPYSGGPLLYTIECLSDPKMKVKDLPELYLNTGINKYDIDFSDNTTLKSGKEYLLKLTLPNKEQLRLRFIYKNE